MRKLVDWISAHPFLSGGAASVFLSWFFKEWFSEVFFEWLNGWVARHVPEAWAATVTGALSNYLLPLLVAGLFVFGGIYIGRRSVGPTQDGTPAPTFRIPWLIVGSLVGLLVIGGLGFVLKAQYDINAALAPRQLTDEQAAKIVEYLLPRPRQKIHIVHTYPDNEAGSYAAQFLSSVPASRVGGAEFCRAKRANGQRHLDKGWVRNARDLSSKPSRWNAEAG
jgi:hypothetical protein